MQFNDINSKIVLLPNMGKSDLHIILSSYQIISLFNSYQEHHSA